MKKFKFLLFSLTVIFASCSDDDKAVEQSNFSLSISGLENLGANYVYEGWLVNGSDVTSSGRFSVNSSGVLSQTSFVVEKSKLEASTTFVLTIEPAVGDVPAPSDVHILAGNFSGNTGALTVSHPAALANNFASATGKYILATPTDGGMMTNEDSGLWFLDNSGTNPVAGLNLPTLPMGWKYEGWAVVNGVPVSTGTFTSVSGADSSAPFSGVNAGPPFPGEDFLMNAPTGLTFPTNLRGGMAVISKQPYPDNSSAPFLLKPLVHSIPAAAAIHTVLNMNLNAASFPTGTISR
jgi:hypothetical protein